MWTQNDSRGGRDVKGAFRACVAVGSLVLCLGAVAGAGGPQGSSLADRLAAAALERTHHSVAYDGSYRKIGYPMGDVPENIGVCTDLVVRAYRAVGIDLQKLVHEDMVRHFAEYPRAWGLKAPDSNIDHRRVPNLATFFERHGDVRPVTGNGKDYRTGDLVTWRLPGNLPHIGIVGSEKVAGTGRPYVIHNIGMGPRREDMLFRYEITGHYRYPR